MHAKYEVYMTYGSKVTAKIEGFFLPQSRRQIVTDRTKLDAPEFHCGGMKIIILLTDTL